MKRLSIALLALTVVAGSASAQLVSLSPGNAYSLVGNSGVAWPYNGDTLVTFSLDIPVTGANVSGTRFTGLLDTEVDRESDGTLDFLYEYIADPKSLDAVERITM